MRNKVRTQRRLAMLAAASIVTVTAVGCSSSNTADSDTSSGTESNSPGNPATGSPITIGYSNTEGKGALSVPSYTAGVELGIKWVNDHGGIDGHPLVLDKCLTDGSAASSLSCANRFVANKVPVVLSGYDLGVDAMVPVLNGAKIPLFGVALQGTKAQANPEFYQVSAPLPSIFAVPFDAFAKAGKKKIAFVSADVPTVQVAFGAFLKPLASKLGLSLSLVTYDPSSLDFSAAVATLKANGIEGAIFGGNDDMCVGFVNAATSTGYDGVVNTGVCHKFLGKYGSRVAGYQSVSFLYPPEARDSAPKAKQTEIDQYLNDAEQAGEEDNIDGASLAGYASVMDLQDILTTVDGSVTAASAAAAFKSLSGFEGFAGNTIDCAHRAAAQGASCDTELLLLEVDESGEKLTVLGDGYVPPPAG